MTDNQKTVLIAGATGYLGQRLVRAYAEAGYRVHALARRPEGLASVQPLIDEVIIGEVTRPDTLTGCCYGVDLVVSAVGITRQREGLSYDQVDYRANSNLLQEAMTAGVERFAYIHVLNAEHMPHVKMVKAKSKFAAELAASPMASTIICPSGFFSDLSEILQMARNGRVYLFGDGESRISPIDGSDLAELCVRATEERLDQINVGGPETFTQNEIAELAFEVLGRPARMAHIPVSLGQFFVSLMNLFGLASSAGPVEFFLAASTLDMSAPPHGYRTLEQAFRAQLPTQKYHQKDLT